MDVCTCPLWDLFNVLHLLPDMWMPQLGTDRNPFYKAYAYTSHFLLTEVLSVSLILIEVSKENKETYSKLRQQSVFP